MYANTIGYANIIGFKASGQSILNRQTINHDQSNLVKGRIESVGEIDTRVKYNISCVSKSLHPKQELDPFTVFAQRSYVKPHDRQ